MFYWGWVVCFAFLVASTVCCGVTFSFNELVVPLSKEYPSSLAFLNWIGAITTSLSQFLAPVATICYFKFGIRKTVLLGVVGTTLGLGFTAWSQHIAMYLVFYGLVYGSSMTLIVNPPFFLTNEYFPYEHPRHVLATSIIACGFPIATLAFNPISLFLIDALGWRLTYVALAAMLFVMNIIAVLTYRNRNEKDEMSIEETESYKTKESEKEMLLEIKITKKAKVIMSCLWFAVSTFKAIGYFTPYLTLVKQAITLGISPGKATILMTTAGCGEVLSRLIMSFIGDYIKGKTLHSYVGFCIALAILNFTTILASSFTHMMIYAVGLGVLGGPILAAMYSCSSEVLKGQEVPLIFTLYRVGVGVGIIAGPTFTGMIYDLTGEFTMVYIMTGGTYTIASLLYGVIIVLNKYQPNCVYGT